MTTTNHSTQSRTPEGRVSGLVGELILPAVLVVLGVLTAIGTATMTVIGDGAPGPQFFPTIIAVLLLGTGVAMAAVATVTHRRAGGPRVAEPPPRADLKTLGIVFAALVVFVIVMPYAGWLLSAAALFFVISWALGSGALLRTVLISFAFSALLQIAFSIGLGLNLPAGVIGEVSSWIS